jgi:hypothetical protein
METTLGARTAPGRNSERACDSPSRSGPHGQLGRKSLGVVREEVCAGLRGAAVEIERRLDGSHWLRYRGRYLHLRHCPEPARTTASPSGLRPPGLAEQPPRPKNKITPKYDAPANHPWRKPSGLKYVILRHLIDLRKPVRRHFVAPRGSWSARPNCICGERPPPVLES